MEPASNPPIPNIGADPSQLATQLMALRDLAAQEAMAHWAQLMFYASIAQLALAVAGTLALLATLRHSRQANKIARLAVIGTQRAWISVDLVINGPVTDSHQSVHADVAIKITNVGPSPALNVHTNVTLAFDVLKTAETTREFAALHRKRDIENGRLCLPGQTYLRHWVASGKIKDIPEHLRDTSINLLVLGCVTYDVHGDDEVHQTTFSFIVRRKDGGRFVLGTGVLPDALEYEAWSGGGAD